MSGEPAAASMGSSSRKKTFDTAMGPVTDIDEKYKGKGMSIYTFLIIVFVGFSIGFIIYKYSLRSKPAITVDYKEQDWQPPAIYLYPENFISYQSGYCSIDYMGDGDLPAGYECDISIDEYGWNVLEFPGVKVTDVPGLATFETYYRGNTTGFHESYIYIDGSKASVYYVAAEPWNSLTSKDNNLVMTVIQYQHLDSTKDSTEYSLSITSNVLAYDDSSPWHTDFDDSEYADTSYPLTQCVGEDDSESCSFSSLIYFQFQTRTVQIIKEVDPVQWGEIMGTLGGYWVYVGAFFGLLFAKNPQMGNEKLYPSKIAKKLLCIKE